MVEVADVAGAFWGALDLVSRHKAYIRSNFVEYVWQAWVVFKKKKKLAKINVSSEHKRHIQAQ